MKVKLLDRTARKQQCCYFYCLVIEPIFSQFRDGSQYVFITFQ